MPVNLKGRSFLTLKDFTPDEIRYMLNLAADLKAKKRAGIRGDLLAGKNIVLLFDTRISHFLNGVGIFKNIWSISKISELYSILINFISVFSTTHLA